MDIRLAAIQITIDVIEKGRDLDILLAKYATKVEYKRSLNAIIIGVLKNLTRLDFIIATVSEKPIKAFDYKVRAILRLAFYEIIYQQTPEYAVINTYVDICKSQNKKASGLVNAVLRKYSRVKYNVSIPNEPLSKYFSIEYSHPEWMIKNWLENYSGKDVEKILKYNNTAPKLTLRINSCKANIDSFIKVLSENNIEHKKSIVPDCIEVLTSIDIHNIPGYKEGLWAVQAESSALVAQVLNPKQNDVILDVCAAPGGKTTYIASLCNDVCAITALDVSKKRIEKINENIKRLELKSITTTIQDATIATFEIKYDKILIDAPCSNTGVLCKRVDARWKRKPEDINLLSEIQYNILNNISKYLKVDGELVYSTCSIENKENIHIINKFLETHSDFELVDIDNLMPFKSTGKGFIQILQSKHNIDGFFIAKLKRVS